MDLSDWVEEAESLQRMDGLWPDTDEVRARGVLEEAALQGPEPLARAVRALRREFRETGVLTRDRSLGPLRNAFARH